MTTPSQAWAFVIDAGAAGDVLSETHDLADDLHLVHGLNASAPLIVTINDRTVDPTVTQTIDLAGDVVAVTRQ